MVTVGLAESFSRQRVEALIRSATEHVERREALQRERKTCTHGYYYRHVFRASEVVDCTVLSEMSFSAVGVLSRRALQAEQNEVRLRFGKLRCRSSNGIYS